MEIPLFPLHVVLAPGAPLPLHVFEPRYRTLVTDCLAAGAPFGVVCIRAGQEVGGGSVSFATVGTLAEIREVVRHPDGRFDILTVGTARFRLASVDGTSRPYLLGIGELLDEPLGDPRRVARLADNVRSRFARYLELLQAGSVDRGNEPLDHDAASVADIPSSPAGPAPAAEPLADLEAIAAAIAPRDDPTAFAHVVSALVQAELPLRQRLLEAETTEARLADLDSLLARETSLLARRLGPYAPDPRALSVRRN